MLERETELIRQIVLESTINGRNAVKLNEVIAASLPRGIKSFMTARVAGMLEDDLRSASRLRKITEGIGSTVTAERTLLHSLAMEYTLNREEFTKLTEDTIHFLENYLCRPQWTLNQLMFEKANTITFIEMIRKFEIVSEYSYFALLVERHARRKELREIEAGYFKQLLARIDNEIVKQHSPRELALLAKPIFDFLLLGEHSMTRPIPLGAILLFYEDKNLMNVKTYIERICQVRNKTQLSMSELIEIIEDLYNVETTVQKEVEESELEILSPHTSATQSPAGTLPEDNGDAPQPAPEEAKEESTDPSAIAEPAQTSEKVENGVHPPEATPSEQQAGEEFPAETQTNPVLDIDTEILEDDIPEPAVEIPRSIGAELLVEYARERQAAMRGKQPDTPEQTAAEQRNDLPDVNDLLNSTQHEKFVRTVFQDDEAYYGIFLAAINRTATWREAQQHLRELFELKKLDILAPEVIEFTDAMHSRFDPSLRRSS